MRTTVHHTPRRGGRPESEPPESLWARLSVIALMVLVLIAAGLLSAMTAMRFTIRGQEVVVPGVEGMVQSDAANLLNQTGLELEVSGRRFSDSVPEGRIVEQNPLAGTRVKQSRSVHALLSVGERRFPVPDVAGASFRSAQIVLGQRGLSVGNTVYSHTRGGEASTVADQSPAAGDAGTDDPSVNLLVSLGPLDQYYRMPDVTDQPAEAVVRRMRAEGFRVGEPTYVRQSGVPAGRVMRQQPASGYKVSRSDIISIEVSQ